jgi:dolichyl-diphosphooligosaccharide--protein glycosyltransferase
MVRDATPETSGFLAADGEPEYGILAKPSHANAYLYGARRAVSANGFGPYLDEAAHALVSEFFLTREERRAVTIARRLRARYAVVHANAHRQPGMLTHLLERSDGSSDADHAGRFRLVVEGPAGGTPMHTSFPRGAPRGVLPYKLFEIVEGVLLEAQARPGTRLSATLEVETNTGRRFTFRARSLADETGVARLRLPYATERSLPTRATGPYRVRLGVRRYAVEATDQDVERGLRIRLADG